MSKNILSTYIPIMESVGDIVSDEPQNVDIVIALVDRVCQSVMQYISSNYGTRNSPYYQVQMWSDHAKQALGLPGSHDPNVSLNAKWMRDTCKKFKSEIALLPA